MDGNSPLLKLETGVAEPRDPKNTYSSCNILASDLDNLDDVKSLIEASSKMPISTAYIFTPFVPSFSFSAYLEGKKILLKEGDSTLKIRQGDQAKTLVDLIQKHCKQNEQNPTPATPSQ